MYERFYGLHERPFSLTPDPDYLYLGRVHEEALGYLRYGIETQAGFVVITGEIGSGKTTLLQALLRDLDRDVTYAHLVNTRLDAEELLEAVLLDLGLDPAGKSKPVRLYEMANFLVNERNAGRTVLVVIDEAQNLNSGALEELRLLSNLETEKSKLLHMILVGQPELRNLLARPDLEQLRQRVTVSYHIRPLDSAETGRYIDHRLRRASLGAPLQFPPDATARIHEESGGIPRLINVICDATLVFGYASDRSNIDVALVDEAMDELEQTGVLRRHGRRERVERVSGTAGTAVPADEERLQGPSADEQALIEREQRLLRREREVAEQARVLAREHEMVRALEAEGRTARQGPRDEGTWPPASGRPSGGGGTATEAFGRSFEETGEEDGPISRMLEAEPGIWQKLKHALFGRPVLDFSSSGAEHTEPWRSSP